MRPILIAAGRGQRLGHNTNEQPKTLVAVLGRPIIEWILEAFVAAGFSRKDVVCISGYRQEVLRSRYPEFTYVHNADWENNNVLLSLMHARAYLGAGFISSYADIVYERGTITELERSPADCTIVCDTDWRRRYRGRTQHPETDAEKVSTNGQTVLRVSRQLAAHEASSEFIGVLRATARGSAELLEHFDRFRASYQGKPWCEGRSFERAYLIDLLQASLELGFRIDASFLTGGYMEIDTLQDLELAAEWWAGRPR